MRGGGGGGCLVFVSKCFCVSGKVCVRVWGGGGDVGV